MSEKNTHWANKVFSSRWDWLHFRILWGITLSGLQQMAHSAARAMLMVDYVGLNGVFAVSSSPAMKKVFIQEFSSLHLLLTNREKAQRGSR